jgi:hypothetical protein
MKQGHFLVVRGRTEYMPHRGNDLRVILRVLYPTNPDGYSVRIRDRWSNH